AILGGGIVGVDGACEGDVVIHSAVGVDGHIVLQHHSPGEGRRVPTLIIYLDRSATEIDGSGGDIEVGEGAVDSRADVLLEGGRARASGNGEGAILGGGIVG